MVGKGFIKGSVEAFGPGGDFDMKYRYNSNFSFDVSLVDVEPLTLEEYSMLHPFEEIAPLTTSEYGNYLAGYSTYKNYNFMGVAGVKLAGHLDALCDAMQSYIWKDDFKKPPWDEKASRDMISLGIQHAGGYKEYDITKNDPDDVFLGGKKGS